MRRHRLVPMLALVLLLSACGTSTPAQPRTVTQVVTATGTPPATTGTSGTAGITVVGPSSGATGTPTSGAPQTGGTGTAASTTPTTGSPATSSATATTSSAATSTVADKKVNPLHVACTSLLDNNDIKTALGAAVSSASSRIVDVANPKIKMTGKIKCYYGMKSGAKDHPVTVALAQYASTAAAQTQMDVTKSSEVSLGAQASEVTVSGRNAHVLLRDGGLLIMRYDTWTLSIAVENKLASASALPTGLQKLATMVLARVLKNG